MRKMFRNKHAPKLLCVQFVRLKIVNIFQREKNKEKVVDQNLKKFCHKFILQTIVDEMMCRKKCYRNEES